MIRAYGETIRVVAYSLITIIGDAGDRHLDALFSIDATLGLAFAGTGVLYPCSARCSAGWASR